MPKPTFKLVGSNDEIIVSIDERSWHILDHPYFFKQGQLLREAFGMDFIKGCGKKPKDGLLKSMPVSLFDLYCKSVYPDLLRDQDILPYAYSYEFEREKGIKQGGGISGFKVRELFGFIDVRPAGFCTLKLSEIAPNGVGRIVEILDMRKSPGIETDWGNLKIHRRAMIVDWYEEMPRILKFCEQNKNGNIEVRLPNRK